MNFSSKKRPRRDAWKELQSELDEREKVEEENEEKFRKMDKLKFRVTVDDELDPDRKYAYIDIEIGRKMGREPRITKGRIIFELFDDIMPRTIEKFCQMLENEREPTYRGSTFSKIFSNFMCEAGDRQSQAEGALTLGREQVFSRVEQEANWRVPHLNPGILSLTDAKTSKFNLTFRKCEELDGWHAVFGKVVYGFDVLREINEQSGQVDGSPKQPVVIVHGAVVPKGKHPREYLKAIELPEDEEAHGYKKKVMRYCSTYRHTGVIGH
jgi:cyclophilin family peptidyl-prolyl cis-trans isomerase